MVTQAWQNLGPGCCSDLNGLETAFNNHLPPGAATLTDCQRKCETYAGCKYVHYGWAHAPRWCSVYVASNFAGRTCLPLDSRPNSCGSSGDNGVHTWDYIPPARAGTHRLLQAACAISKHEASQSTPRSGWSWSLEMSEARRLLAVSARHETLSSDILPFLPRLLYEDDAALAYRMRNVPNFSSPGHVDFHHCGAGSLALHLLSTLMMIEKAASRDRMFSLATIMSDLIESSTSWVYLMRSGWPIFAMLAWCSRRLSEEMGHSNHLFLLTTEERGTRAVQRIHDMLRVCCAGGVVEIALTPRVWRTLAKIEQRVFNESALAELSAPTCPSAMYCGGERSPNRYNCACERVFAPSRTKSKMCVLSGHDKVRDPLVTVMSVMKASFWTLSSTLNRWYTFVNNGSFYWWNMAKGDMWAKITAIRELLDTDHSCEWVAWIDSDAYFATTERMEAVIETSGKADIILPKQEIEDGNATAHFMLFKASDLIKSFFKFVHELPHKQPDVAGRFLTERFHDQSVINLVLRQIPFGLDVISGLKVGYVSLEEFGQLNSRLVVHQGGPKYEHFRLRLVAEVLARVRNCRDCFQDPLWRKLRTSMGNSSVEDTIKRFVMPLQMIPIASIGLKQFAKHF